MIGCFSGGAPGKVVSMGFRKVVCVPKSRGPENSCKMGPKSRGPWLSPGKQHLGFCIHENIRKMVPKWNVHFSVARARLCSCLLTPTVWQDWAYCSPVERPYVSRGVHGCSWSHGGGRAWHWRGAPITNKCHLARHVDAQKHKVLHRETTIRKTAVNYYYYFTFHFSRDKWHLFAPLSMLVGAHMHSWSSCPTAQKR